jgi:hypothetical protein
MIFGMALRPTHPPSTRHNFGYCQLWRDDLADIVEAMRHVAPDLVLETDNYAFDDVGDLVGLRKRTINSFTAESRKLRILLHLSKDESFIYAEDPDPSTRNMILAVSHITQRHRRWVSFRAIRAAPPILMFLSLTAGSAMLVAEGLQPTGSDNGFAPLLFACTAASIMFFAAVKQACRRAAVLATSVYKTELPWLVRNRDSLVANALVSAVFMALAFFWGYMAPK